MPEILVVDDDRNIRAVMRQKLERRGCDAVLCSSAEEAAGVMAERDVDAVLLDLYLPGMDGLAFLQQIHRDHGPVPVIMMSGSREQRHAIAAMRLDATDFLQKPVDDDCLDRALSAAMKDRTYQSLGAPAAPAPESPDGHEGASAPAPDGAARAVEAAMREVGERIRAGDVELPVLDERATEVYALVKEPGTGVDTIVDLVGADQTLAATCLRAANSSVYGADGAISSLRQACVRLGNRRVLAFAVEAVTRSAFATTRQPFRDMMTRQWRNALVTARILERLASIAYRSTPLARLALPDPEDLYVAGLLHNVGELLLLHLLSGVPSLDVVTESERVAMASVIHARHESFGRRLALRWGLPRMVSRLAGAHHRPLPGKEAKADAWLRKLLLAAWAIAIEGGHDYLPGASPPSATDCLAGVGVDPAQVAPLYEEMEAWDGEG